jgi:hypothetical protein
MKYQFRPLYNIAIQYPRFTILEHQEFQVDLNYVQVNGLSQLMVFIHLDITIWSPSVLRKLQSLWVTEVIPKLPKYTFCHGEVSDHKFHKFVTKFGFSELITAVCTDGTNRPIYCYINFDKD